MFHRVVFVCVCLSFFFSPLMSVADEAHIRRPLKVGVIVPLSGAFADYGVATRNGIEMAMANESDPQNIQFVFEDSQYDAKQAVSALRKLQEIDRVQIVFNWGTGTSQALAPIAEANRLPLIAQSTEPGFNLGMQFVIRFGIRAEQYAAVLLQYFREHGWKRIGIVAADVVFFREILDGLRRLARTDENVREIETFAPNETDFRSLFLRLRKENVQILGAFLSGGQVSPFFLQKEQLGFQAPIFGMNTFDSRNDIQRVGRVMNGAVYPTVGATADFRQKYLLRYGNDVQLPFAALGHDFVSLLYALPDLLQAKSGEEILAALKTVHAFSGATGKVEFTVAKDSGPAFTVPAKLQRVTDTGVEDVPQ